jgi:hypothetical protein
VLSTVFSAWIVPETRGRSLEELERELGRLRLCGPASDGPAGDGSVRVQESPAQDLTK